MNVLLRRLSISLVFGGILGCSTSLQPQRSATTLNEIQFNGGDFDEHIRKSEPCSPEEELAGFVLQPGFKIELFASEPLIGKPLNMAFDAKGRLWVTQSAEYPAPATVGKGKDRITILEDTNHDGRADRFTPVLDTLNIPIGLLPLNDGLLTYSIPNLYRYTDTNHDGQLDQTRRLLGPFEYKDTHGMVNHLTRGFDGWIQACHGFTNLSKVMGTDGDTLEMGSGNTFRFRLDGSRAELFTKGRVNPFGLVYDNWGYLYSPDSHSSPLTQLIRGADYPHFGRIAEGIGFAPQMKPHEKEATALSGIALPSSSIFPEAYRKSLYIGDVVKCRIYRNSFTFNGTSPTAKSEADLLRSTDPWFRPVDILEGPDGALYVADFYNRIIGHYEVPLDNPGRDRQRGRIWRITYQGKTDKIGYTDWTKSTIDELIKALAVGNLPVRMLVTDQLVNRIGQPAVEPLLNVLKKSATQPDQYVHSLWALHQLNALPEAVLLRAAQHKNPLIRTHAMRALHESPLRNEARYAVLKKNLLEANPHVQRAAVESLTDYPTLETVRALLAFQPGVPSTDTHLAYTLTLAFRTLLRNKPLGNDVTTANWTPRERSILATPMSGVNQPYAGQFLFNTVNVLTLDKEAELKYLGHAARYLPASDRDDLVSFVRQKYDTDLSSQFTLFRIIQQSIKSGRTTNGLAGSTTAGSDSRSDGSQSDGSRSDGSVKQWSVVLANQLVSLQPTDWSFNLAEFLYLKDHPVIFSPPPQNTTLAKNLKFLGFEQGGYKGVIKSPVFTAPKSLSFIAIQVNGITNIGGGHLVRLVSATDTTNVLACTEFIKTNDYRAEQVNWDLSAHAGEKVRLEIADNSSGIIRIGTVQGLPAPLLPAVSPKDIAEQKRFGMELVGELGLTALEPMLKETLLNKTLPYYFRLSSAKALMKLAPEQYAATLGGYIEDEKNPVGFRTDLASVLGDSPNRSNDRRGDGLRGDGPSPIQIVMEAALKRTKGDVQLGLLKSLATSSFGKDLIMSQVYAGTLYTRILVQPGIEDRLMLNISENQKAKFRQLTANLSPIDEEREKLIVSRLSSFTTTPGIPESGKQVFVANCSACHQIAKEGGLIGPQLDGIGSWGSKSLATKILDPNRNISEAFRTYTVILKSGSVKTGLFRRDDEQSITYADATGAEFVVSRNDIAEIQPSRHTLMPDQFGKVLPEKEFNDLLGYLLSVK